MEHYQIKIKLALTCLPNLACDLFIPVPLVLSKFHAQIDPSEVLVDNKLFNRMALQ